MKITYQRSLLYYDCDLIFEAADDAGRKYLAVHHDDLDTGCEYAVIPVNPPDLAQLKAGRLDLRSLILAAPGGKWYTAQIGGDTGAIMLDAQPTPVSSCESLPDEGYYVAVNNPEPGALRLIENSSPSTGSQPKRPASAPAQ